MLVKMTSSTSGELIMLAEQMRRLFEIIGKEGTARGVFTLEQLPEAIERLQEAVNAEKQALQEAAKSIGDGGRGSAEEDGAAEGGDDSVDGEASDPPPVTVHLAQRAYPLIHLMQLTLNEKGFILWEAGADF